MDWAMSNTDNPDEAICCLVSKLLPPKGSSVLPPLRTCDEQAAEMLVGIVLTLTMTANWLKPENAFRRLLKAIKPKCKKGLGMSYKLQIALALDWLSIHVPGQSVSGSGILEDKFSFYRRERDRGNLRSESVSGTTGKFTRSALTKERSGFVMLT